MEPEYFTAQQGRTLSTSTWLCVEHQICADGKATPDSTLERERYLGLCITWRRAVRSCRGRVRAAPLADALPRRAGHVGGVLARQARSSFKSCLSVRWRFCNDDPLHSDRVNICQRHAQYTTVHSITVLRDSCMLAS